MSSLNRDDKVTSENCGTPTTRIELPFHKNRCSIGLLSCSQYTNFTTNSQNDLNCHSSKKHSATKPVLTFKCKLYYQTFRGFYAFPTHKNIKNGFLIKTGNVHLDDLINEVDEMILKEELPSSCQIFLVASELERARHKVFNYAVENLNDTIVNEKLDLFFNNLKCAAKVNLAFGSFLKNIEVGGFRYFYAHGNNTLLDGSKLVCTKDDLAELKDVLKKIASSSRVVEKE